MERDLYHYMHTCNKQKCTDYEFNEVFMFVKNYCHFSKAAAELADVLCPNKVRCLDLETQNYVLPTDLNDELKKDYMIPHYIQRFNQLGFTKVPQIFVHGDDGWKYVGGSDDFHAFTGSNSMAGIQVGFQSVKL